jgi:hypothetical protein
MHYIPVGDSGAEGLETFIFTFFSIFESETVGIGLYIYHHTLN